MEFQVRYLALFLLFSVIDDFEWFWMESLHKNIQLMLEFLKAPFLVLHFSHYALITFLMMLSVTLLSMLMILLSTFTCDQASDLWFWTWIWPTRHCVLGQELACWFQCWKDWFCLTGLITLVLLMWKLMDLLLKKNHLLRCSSSLCLIDWSSYIISIAKTRKLKPLFVLWIFFLLGISINKPYGLA